MAKSEIISESSGVRLPLDSSEDSTQLHSFDLVKPHSGSLSQEEKDVLFRSTPNIDVDGKEKPRCRGRIHRAAFYACILMCLILSILAKDWSNKIAMIIYFCSQMITFGVSSLYHMGSYKSKKDMVFMQKLDHAGSFYH